jgi:sugar-specific transcriptional regulator TrmB
MFVRDDAEALFFTKPRAETSVIELDDICLWTDCNTLANAFIAVFEDLWHNSTEIQQKIEEFETGRPTPKTATITDAEMAKKKFHTTLQSAKKEITILTSCMGLQGLSKYLPEFKKLREKRVAIKIMSPIVTENLKASKQLSKLCSIRHVPPNYTPTTIIDKQYLFQFSASNLREKLGIQPIHFENTLFTTNPEYIKKNTTMLREIWKNSRPPSADNLTALFGPYVRSQAAFAPGAIRSPGPDGTYHPLPPNDSKTKDAIPIIQIQDEDPEGKMTEQDVLKEIIKVQQSHQSPDTLGNLHIYSSQGIAVIHPPDFFKLPPFLIRVHHIDKHSTYGAEDVIMINLWLETDSGPAYVPVAVFGDNSTAQDWWKRHFEATPAGKNVQLSRKDELQVWIHGNTLFAAWTIPIILYPSHYILPPACILFEGYGKVKTEAFSIIDPLGGKATAKQNGFDAFVTFMHQSSKYSGPGTDGFLVRDFVMELTPQFIDEFHPTMETNLAEKRKTESTSFKNGRVKMQ